MTAPTLAARPRRSSRALNARVLLTGRSGARLTGRWRSFCSRESRPNNSRWHDLQPSPRTTHLRHRDARDAWRRRGIRPRERSALGSCSAIASRAALCPTCRPSSCRRQAGARGPKEPVLASACHSSFRALWSAATKDGLEFVRSRAFRLGLRLLAHRWRSLSFRSTSLSGAGRCGAGFGAGGGFGLSLMT